MDWSPICNYTHYSLLRGFSKPQELAEKCKQSGYKACGITDYKSLSGAVAFYKACKSNKIKPIIGCSFDGFTLIATNKQGWFDLIRIVSSMDSDNNPESSVVVDVCSNKNLICIADDESVSPVKGDLFFEKDLSLKSTYYTNREDAGLHRILLCSSLKTTLPKIRKAMTKEDGVGIAKFFDRSDYHLPDSLEVSECITNGGWSVSKSKEIASLCEEYEILSKPSLPEFPCSKSEEETLKDLCRKGWVKRLIDTGKVKKEEDKEIYLARFHKELAVIKEANLFGYFLIVQDILRYVKGEGWMSGPGRGSAAGCLISYLIGITEIDPIEFGLLFERFYNSGRNTGDHVSLPDIDVDVPGNKRDEIIGYLKEKYGKENVSQMITFGRLQGRSALKEVLRVNAACSFGEMNEITKSIPNEADISDQLEAMDEEDRSIIRWALINSPEELRDFCFINDKNCLDGDYAEYFEQAIRIEGTFRNQGKHAAGVVISANKLRYVCPMVNQKSSTEKIAGLEMSDLEALGHVKFDILGINLLDKLMKIKELING
jgi:DNA polymerase-3 subunit alpha